jgi:hypothetical protein
MKILTNVVWRFKRLIPAKIDEFNEVFTRYQFDILGEKANWNCDAVVVDSPTVGITYTAWLKSPTELFDNEIAVEKEGFFENLNNRDSDGLYQTNIAFELIADNECNFLASELMYKISHQISSRNLGDRVYFEGLQEIRTDSEFLCFRLMCGS